MFTSRSEYRMTLRADNADSRLTEKGMQAGVISPERWATFLKTKSEMERATEVLKSVVLSPQKWIALGFLKGNDGVKRNAYDMLRSPGVTTSALLSTGAVPGLASFSPSVLARIEVEGLYALHVRRQEADLKAFMEDETLLLDPQMDYQLVKGLSSEVKEKLARVRPASIGAAKRIEGMTPSSLVYLLQHTKRTFSRSEFAASLLEGSQADPTFTATA
jgi:tRNA uridine 5-carboxymethylaminomethyl modification enzyme